MAFPISHVRSCFPSLVQTDNAHARIYMDNPASTQVPLAVADAVRDYMLTNTANAGGHFKTSIATDAVWLKAHQDAALFGC